MYVYIYIYILKIADRRSKIEGTGGTGRKGDREPGRKGGQGAREDMEPGRTGSQGKPGKPVKQSLESHLSASSGRRPSGASRGWSCWTSPRIFISVSLFISCFDIFCVFSCYFIIADFCCSCSFAGPPRVRRVAAGLHTNNDYFVLLIFVRVSLLLIDYCYFVSIPIVSLLRFGDSKFPGDSPVGLGIPTLNLRFRLSQTL